jgi:Tol biopolymer transport system component/predicted Ser/Thr protein kinase
MIGQTIAHYHVSAKLGEGGMGAVYRAHDSKLGRDVAIKVLPPSVAADSEYLARFRREAHVLAALNHPNIAAIYAVEEGAIVMELVEGAELRGPLPVAEALPIARQIAEALEAAHERGIVHRDLKPANIKITPKGTVKVLDFGLAKTPEVNSTPTNANSPTLTLRSTHAGMIMGTAAYMSPEQARGKPVDHRADIWAFGVVLFELLTGKETFPGDTVTDILAGIVKEEPDWSTLPANTPPRIRRLLERCLRKDPRTRLQAIAEARILIDEPEPPAAAVTTTTRHPSAKLPWLLAAAALIALAAALVWLWPHPDIRPLVRVGIDLGAEGGLDERFAVAFSPDGKRIAYYTRGERGRIQLVSRALDQATSQTLAETEVAGSPFFSPDSQWIAFIADGRLRKVSVDGGPVTAIARDLDVWGMLARSSGSWGDNDVIVLSGRSGLMKVPVSGGVPTPLTDAAQSGDGAHGWPQVLPGAHAALFSSFSQNAPGSDPDIKSVHLETGEQTTILKGASQARYVQGKLLFNQAGVLHAARFDPGSLRIRGTPVRIDPVGANTWFETASSGMVIFAATRTQTAHFRLLSIDRSGGMKEIGKTLGDYRSIRISPDGTRLLYTAGSEGGRDVWVYDLRRDTPFRLTAGNTNKWDPIWSADGKHVVYSTSNSGGSNTFWWVPADGSREPAAFFTTSTPGGPRSFTPDGRLLVYEPISPETRADIFILPLDLSDPSSPKAGSPEPYLTSSFNERHAAISPDGRWIAYSSNESGQQEIYVRAFPKPEGKQQISAEGGDLPLWSAQTRELLYRGADDRLMAVPYDIRGGQFQPGRPAAQSDAKLPPMPPGPNKSQDISPDGKTLFVLARSRDLGRPESRIHLIVNFLDEVDRRLAARK